MHMENIRTVIIGAVHHNTLGVVRSLGEEGVSAECIQLILVGHNIKKKNFVSVSKYVISNNVFVVENDNELLATLDGLKDKDTKKVIICCSDASAEVVMKNCEQLSEFFYTPSVAISVEELLDKQNQNEIASKFNLSIPYGREMNLEELREWERFPCIIKPGKSILGAGKADIHVVESKEELDRICEGIKASIVLVQEYVKKKIEFQLIGCSLDDGKKVIIPGYTNILRQPENTNTGYLVYSPISELTYDEKSVKRFIESIGYNGLFSIEFIRNSEDKDFYLEINLRNDGNAYCVKTAGVNLPFIWCYYSIHKSLPEGLRLVVDEKVYFMPEFPDAKRGIKEVGFLRWLKEFKGAKSHAIYNRQDMKPFWKKIIDSVF